MRVVIFVPLLIALLLYRPWGQAASVGDLKKAEKQYPDYSEMSINQKGGVPSARNQGLTVF